MNHVTNLIISNITCHIFICTIYTRTRIPSIIQHSYSATVSILLTISSHNSIEKIFAVSGVLPGALDLSIIWPDSSLRPSRSQTNLKLSD